MEITFGVLIFCIVAFFVAGFIDSIAGGAGFVTAPSADWDAAAHGARNRKASDKYRLRCGALDFLAKQPNFEEDRSCRRALRHGGCFFRRVLCASD